MVSVGIQSMMPNEHEEMLSGVPRDTETQIAASAVWRAVVAVRGAHEDRRFAFGAAALDARRTRYRAKRVGLRVD